MLRAAFHAALQHNHCKFNLSAASLQRAGKGTVPCNKNRQLTVISSAVLTQSGETRLLSNRLETRFKAY